MLNTHLQYLIQIDIMNLEHIGGVLYRQLPPKKTLMLFDSLGLDGFKIFIVDNDKRIIDELLFNFKKCKIS